LAKNKNKKTKQNKTNSFCTKACQIKP